ncbi:MAG: lipoyl(octanoyl) transferase LipB [Candidatus Sumerlaeaceae bacterium]
MKTSPHSNLTYVFSAASRAVGKTIFSDANASARWLGRVAYLHGLAIMESLLCEKMASLQKDWFLYLEHEPVITYGRTTPAHHLPPTEANIPRLEVSRGGLATYHGPGQLVGYVICDLRRRARGAPPDLHEFLRALEEGIAAYLTEEWHLFAGSLEGRTGVWITNATPPRKIVSIGIGVRRWITYHGFAINVFNDLQIFSQFVPCGLEGVTMTSLAAELQVKPDTKKTLDLKAVATALHPYVISSLRLHGWCWAEVV